MIWLGLGSTSIGPTLTDDQYWVNLRFVNNDVRRLAALLGLPALIHVSNGCVCTRVDALCMVLRRFAYPNRLQVRPGIVLRQTNIGFVTDYQPNGSCVMGETSPPPDKFRRAMASTPMPSTRREHLSSTAAAS